MSKDPFLEDNKHGHKCYSQQGGALLSYHSAHTSIMDAAWAPHKGYHSAVDNHWIPHHSLDDRSSLET